MATDETARSDEGESTDQDPSKSAKGARPKRYHRPLKVMLSDDQHERLGELSGELNVSKAKVLRLLLDGHEPQSSSDRPVIAPDVYEAAIETLNKVRAELNLTGGNLYRLTRDHYQDPSVDHPQALQKMQSEYEAALKDLHTLAKWIDEVAP